MIDISEIVQRVSIMAIPILVAVTFHELAHGYVSDRLGDPTARLAGRLTLNPLKHLDPIGTLVFLITRMIGWAKPVPVNPWNFKNPVKDMALVAAAGPMTNILIAIVSAVLYRLMAPMIGSGIGEAGDRILIPVFLMVKMSVAINVGLAIFNAIPIPPLDGGRILAGILPREQAEAIGKLEPYGFIILLILIFAGVTDFLIIPVIRLIIGLLIGGRFF